jgi:signal transduction histidine kinase
MKLLSNINLLNEILFRSMAEGSNLAVVKNFTDQSIKIFKADFGFAWGKFSNDQKHGLAYKSPTTPFSPSIPKRKDKTKKDLFDDDIKKGEYVIDISNKAKSYIIIPVSYVNHAYGSIILFFKNKHHFTPEELTLSITVGNIIAQAVTVNWLSEDQEKSLDLAEKQKETEVLLQEEKLKTEFIANATHEFRTPLAIMRGNVELVLRDKKTSLDAAKKALKVVDKEIIRLSALLSDLALLTNPTKNQKRVLHTVQIDLVNLLTKILGRLVVLARNKNISLKINNKLGDLKIMGDEKYLEKLFINLFRNAIIYGKENGIIILDIEKAKNNAIIKVTDDGIGISKDELPHIFERFYRTDKARMMTNIGTGLGLAISKSVVESHGGTISVESTEGKGTTFTIELPIIRKK